ncbi:MAG: SMC family ATPase [Candidatus ainarchaeum sp.]|nr:SMC family ATPase [Candidatus ainarchaeum sp.]MDD3976225.1 SMC family ATPase [Candidatus ainarchaeum sp.]
MIKSIYLENWKTHLDSKIFFQKGSNIILGSIGSGKSSISDAICFALYGLFPSLNNRRLSLVENIMFKPNLKDFSKIILEFEINNINYSVHREIYLSSKPSIAKLYADNKLIAGPKQSDVNSKIFEILKIDYSFFSKIVYSEQNEIDYFLKIPPSKRKETFDDLFGISHFEDMKELIRKLNNFLKTEVDKLYLLYNQYSDQIKNYDILLITEKMKKYFDKIDFLEKNKDLILEENNILKDKLKFLIVLKKEYDFLKLKINVLKENISSYENKINSFNFSKNVFDVKNKINDLDKSLFNKKEQLLLEKNKNNSIFLKRKDLENKVSFYEKEISIFLKKISIEKDNLFKIDKDIFYFKDIVDSFEKKLLFLKEKKYNYLNEINILEKSILELKKGFSKCPVCDSKISSEQINSMIIEKDKSLVFLNDNLINIQKQIDEITNNLNLNLSYLKKIEQNEILLKNISSYEISLNNLKNNLDSSLKLLKDIPEIKDLSVFEKEIDSLISLKISFEDYLKDLNNFEKFKKDLENINLLFSKNCFDENEYISLNSKIMSQDLIFKENVKQINLYKDLLSSITKEKNIYDSLIFKQKQSFDQKYELELKLQDISHFLKSLENSQFQLRKVLIDNINSVLNIIWPKIYAYKDFISARLRSENDYILEVKTLKNDWIRVEGLLSGGERSCASLAIRIAISLVLTESLGLIILDEPTHNLDKESVLLLSKTLEKQLPNLVDQIFIITHDSELLNTLNANKIVIERNKEVDGVSIIK